jgi:predicted AAA+ superfamily ATPase
MFQRWFNLKSVFKIPRVQLILGPRRVGKSTLLRNRYSKYTYVTLDDLDFLEKARSDPKGFLESLGAKFIIDEVQRAPELAIPLKYLVDQEKVQAILSGSTGKNLLHQSVESLAGRVEIFHLPPACFGEDQESSRATHGEDLFKIISFAKDKIRHIEKYFSTFLQYGGFPEVLSAASEKEKEEILNNYKNTYFTRDLADINQLKDVEGLKALYQALIRGLTSRYEISSLSKASGLSVPTTQKYFQSLVFSDLSFKLYGYHLGAAKRYIAAAKTYFCDNGVVSALSNTTSEDQLFEAFVVSEIEKRRKLGFFHCEELFYYESTGGLEIDLIIEERNQVTAIEIKNTKQIRQRDLSNLVAFKLKNEKKKIKKILFYRGHEAYEEQAVRILPYFYLYG